MPKIYVCLYHKGKTYGLRDIAGKNVEVTKDELVPAVKNKQAYIINLDMFWHKTAVDVRQFIKIILGIKPNCTMSDLSRYAYSLGISEEYNKYVNSRVKKLEKSKEIRDAANSMNESYMYANNFHGYDSTVSESEVAHYVVIFGGYPDSVESVHDRQ